MHPTQNPATMAGQPSRRWDGAPETDADRRFFDLRESGYTGPVDQDGYAVDGPSYVDRDGNTVAGFAPGLGARYAAEDGDEA